MINENDSLIPVWPDGLQQVDVVKVCFTLDFKSSCQLLPADFLAIGRVLRLAGRPSSESCDDAALQRWKSLFQPLLSSDPIARRKYQKPAPAFVLTIPILHKQIFSAGDQLDLEVLFLGTGIPLINDFLRSLIHLGCMGLVAGHGRFAVTAVRNREPDYSETVIWQQNEPLEILTCAVQPLTWWLQSEHVASSVSVKFVTPVRLMIDGKPLRKPVFKKIFPFMLRRVTSMLYAHAGIEVLDDPTYLLEQVASLTVSEFKMHWQDWRVLAGRQGMNVGGFVGEMIIQGQALEEMYWILSAASLLGIGKGATYGAGRFLLR